MKIKGIMLVLALSAVIFCTGSAEAGNFQSGDVSLFVFNPLYNSELNITFNLTRYLIPTGESYNATLTLNSTDQEINETISNQPVIIFSLPASDYNLEVSTSNLGVRAKLKNFSVSGRSAHNFSIDRVNTSKNTLAEYLAVYEISSTIDSQSANIWINYSGLSYSNENNLEMFVCTNWNRNAGECSGQWGSLNEVIDRTGDVISAVSSVSAMTAFALFESAPRGAEGPSGGGGGDSRAVPLFLTTDPLEIDVHAIAGEPEIKMLKVKSLAEIPMTFDVVVAGKDIENVVSTLTRISLQPGEERVISVNINPAEKGLLTGRILFRTRNYEYQLPVVINVKSKNFLFDASISVLEQFKRVFADSPIRAQINLLQIGPNESVDVLATYVIKDYLGNVYLEEKETFAVLREKSYVKEFSALGLAPGRYIVGLEIVYPGAFATSSSGFEVIKKKTDRSKILWIALAILAVLMFIWMIGRRKGRKTLKTGGRKV